MQLAGLAFAKGSSKHQHPLCSPPCWKGMLQRSVSLLVTQCLIYSVRAMLPWDEFVNQVCVSSATL